MMHLYIWTGEVCMEVSPICLRDGWLPCVGDVEPPTADGRLLLIEPAIWFKVLVLDAISIDCTRRIILWNCDHDSGSGGAEGADGRADSRAGRRGISESMCVGGELSGSGAELEELFSVLEWLVAEYEVGQLPRQELHGQLLQLLHCFVLPLVTLTPEDLPRIRSELHHQQDRLAAVDDLIMEKNNKLEDILNSQGRQFDCYIQGLVSTSNEEREKYSQEFAEMLYKDIQKEVNVAANRLDYLQEEVDHAKSPALSDSTQDQSLSEKRVERDKGYERYKDLLLAREELHIIIEELLHAKRLRRKPSWRSRRTPAAPGNVLHTIYMELHNQSTIFKDECTRLMERKVLLMSVKEALRVVLNELEAGGTLVRLEQHHGSGQRPTDVLPSVSRGWLSLQEQVAQLLATSQHMIAQQHHRFCNQVRDKCQAALFEKHLSELTSSSVSSSHDPSAMPCGAPSSSLPATINMTPAEPIPGHVRPPLVLSQVECSHKAASMPPYQMPAPRDQETLIQLEGQLGDEDIVILHDTDKNYLKTAIESLKTDIKSHFDDISLKIQSELGHVTKSAYKNIWLCYEVHFYEVTMPHILQVYCAAYLAICDQLQQCMVRLTAQDLDLDQGIIGALLQGTDAIQEAAGPPSDPSQTNDLAAAPAEGGMISTTGSDRGTLTALKEAGDITNQDQACHQHANKSGSRQCLQEELAGDFDMPPKTLQLTLPLLDQDSLSTGECETKKMLSQRPSSITLLYNRRTWPLLSRSCSFEVDTTSLEPADSDQSGLVLLQPALMERFQPALECLRKATRACVPLHKLQQLTGCLREINHQLCFNPEQGTGTGACSDDLIDVLVILLCNWPNQGATELYPHLMLLTDVIPPFFEGGPYSFALVQFSVAFQFLQERLMLKNRIHASVELGYKMNDN